MKPQLGKMLNKILWDVGQNSLGPNHLATKVGQKVLLVLERRLGITWASLLCVDNIVHIGSFLFCLHLTLTKWDKLGTGYGGKEITDKLLPPCPAWQQLVPSFLAIVPPCAQLLIRRMCLAVHLTGLI